MATVLAQAAGITGLTPTMSSASSGGDLVETGDSVFLVVCSDSTPATLTITTPNTVSGLAIADASVTIPASAGVSGTSGPVIVALPTAVFGNASGLAALSWSATTGIKFAVVRR
jgi:hypothetical protein